MTDSATLRRLADVLTLMSVPGVGSGIGKRLLARFGSADTIRRQKVSILKSVKGVSPAIASALTTAEPSAAITEQAATVCRLGWDVFILGDTRYPARLAEIHDPPPVLFATGVVDVLSRPMIAIVGTRRPTDLGRQFARQLASDLAEAGVVVVSGMADGIDAAAHRGTLDAGSSTVAVWGRPLTDVFPRHHEQLAEEIGVTGCHVSELLPGSEYHAKDFPSRNRIIAGLAEATVVVEAAHKSGALITAELALDYNRELFAVPGHPLTVNCAGTNRLLREGAGIVTSAADILDLLPRLRTEGGSRALPADMTETEQQMVALLADGPVQLDQLARSADVPVHEALQYLLALELRGVVREVAGKRFVRA